MKTAPIAILLLCASLCAFAQKQKFVNPGFYNKVSDNVCNGASAYNDHDVIDLVSTICSKVNFKNRFIIASCPNISNCQATVREGKPYILYNDRFLNPVKRLEFSNEALPKQSIDWKVLTILAHEIGHHINWHLVNPEPGMTQISMELEADEFAGYAMYMMGATLRQAQLAMQNPNVSERDSYTHPGRAKRLAAIERGYKKGKRLFPRTTSKPIPTISASEAEVQAELQKAGEAYNKGDYTTAYPIYKKYAYHRLFSAGNQTSLGYMYSKGLGVKEDHKQAVYWYRKAADQGYDLAQYNLGVKYDNGEGVTQDYKQAVYWYRKAADQGYANAQHNLALKYYKGEGVTQDYKQTIYWYRKAADQGLVDAQYNLALRYYKGEGVEQDYTQAVYWYRQAADQGDVNAQYNLGVMYSIGYGVAQNDSQATYWYRQAADQGDADGQYGLAFMYENGGSEIQNDSEAAYWYKKAAKQGQAQAQAACKRLGITW